MLDKATHQVIINLCKKNTESAYLEIQNILLNYIKSNPNDIEVRLKLIKHSYTTSPIEILDIIDYINQLLQHDSDNIYALLYLAYIQRYDFGYMNRILIKKLEKYKCCNNEIMAMTAIAISWYYELIYLDTKNEEWLIEQEKWLKKSLYYCNTIVLNYYELILLYLSQGKKNQACSLIPLALNNIKHVFNENYSEDKYLLDTTNVEEFFNVRYKKIHVFQSFVNDLLSWQN